MKRLATLVSFVIAIVFIVLGFSLLVGSGIPQRADFTGNVVEDLGYVAPELNHTAPPFTLSTNDFEEVTLQDAVGKPIIINFWATWCVPCRTEMTELQSLYTQYENDIRILGINLGESPQAVAQWIDEFGLTYDILLDPLQTVAQLYQIRGQPSTYVLDANLIIHSVYYGPVSMEQLENEIATLLNPR